MYTKSKIFAVFFAISFSLTGFAAEHPDNSWGAWWKAKQPWFHRNQPWLGAVAGFGVFGLATLLSGGNGDNAAVVGIGGALGGAYMGHRGVAITQNNSAEGFEDIEHEKSANKGENREPLIKKDKTTKKSGISKTLSQSSMKPVGFFLLGAGSGTLYGLARYGAATRSYYGSHTDSPEILSAAVIGAIAGAVIGDWSKPKEQK